MSESDSSDPDFAHPVENEFASILDYYGIEWQYEPHTFALAWDEEGNVVEAFRPDFFLPGEGLYVELTTMRPKLMTRKNRKLRLMAELYPEINIKLFRRQDMRDILIRYGLDDQAAGIVGTKAQNSEK